MSLHKLAFLVFLAFTFISVNAAIDKNAVYYRADDIAVTNSLKVVDQKSQVVNLLSTSVINDANVQVALKYEDTELPNYLAFEAEVTYTIKLYRYGLSSQTLTNQKVKIDYDVDPSSINLTPYDESIKKYGSNYYGAEVTITGISFNDGSPSSTIPSDVDGLILEVSSNVERFYDVTKFAKPKVYKTTTANNELQIHWEHIEGAESYDVEWVFVDVPEYNGGYVAQNVTTGFNSGTTYYDFSDATRINIDQSFYNISLAYPAGIIIYRVRGVGRDINSSNYTNFAEGPWSYSPLVFDLKSAYTSTQSYVYSGLDIVKNWSYNVTYAEDGKRKEVINYVDGSSRNRQTTTILNSDQNAIVSETMYDYEGRQAVQTLPTPVVSGGIGFYDNSGNAFNNGFDKYDFDRDATYSSGPDGMSTTATLTSKYYSNNNTSTSMFADFIPDAEEYPYAQTRYKRDGTNRVVSQSGVGVDFKIGQNTTDYYYGRPVQIELDRLFANEAGLNKYYEKNMVSDPNGQVSIEYKDKDGRVVATAIAERNTGSPYEEIDYKPAADLITADLLENNNIIEGTEVKSKTVITVAVPNYYDFKYTLDPQNHIETCANDLLTALSMSSPFTKNCKYDFEVKIEDEDGNLVATSPASPSYTDVTAFNASSSPASFNVGVNLQPGTYTVTKILRINQASRNQAVQDFRDLIVDNYRHEDQTCVPWNLPPSDPCVFDCETACEEQYRRLNPDGTTYTYYDDDNNTGDGGGDYDADDYAAFVAACKLECTPELLPIKDRCEVFYEQIRADMSPGGQYFDNTPAMYLYNGDGSYQLENGEPKLNTSYLSSDINDYMDNAVWSSSLLSYLNSTYSKSYSDWDDVRADWNSAYTDDLMEYHPEYCAYKNYCECDFYEVEFENCTTTYSMDASVCDFPCDDVDCDIYPCTTNVSVERCVPPQTTLIAGDQIVLSSGSGDIVRNYGKFLNAAIEPDYVTSSSIPIQYYFWNPFGLGYTASTGTKSDDQSGYYDRLSGSDPTAGNFMEDPIQLYWGYFDDNGTRKDISFREEILAQLQNFLPVDGSASVTPTKYHSIWYVLNNPDNIHSGSLGGITNTATQNIYGELFGDGTNPGKIGTGSGQISRYDFFKGVYTFYRDYFIYRDFRANNYACSLDANGKVSCGEKPTSTNQTACSACTTSCSNCYIYWLEDGDFLSDNEFDFGDYDTKTNTSPFYTVNFPLNSLYDMYNYMDQSNYQVNVDSLASSTCRKSCHDYAASWIDQIDQDCLDELTSTQITEMKTDLIKVCQLGCVSANNFQGSSDGYSTLYVTPVSAGSPNLYDFDDVVNYYFTQACTTTTCTTCAANISITYPEQASPLATRVDCNCDNLDSYITSLMNQDSASVATSMTSTFAGTYSSSQVGRWMRFCAEDGTAFDMTDLPEELQCIDCKCNMLINYIDGNGLVAGDPYNPTTTEEGNIASDINSNYITSPTLTQSDMDLILQQCSTLHAGTSPTYPLSGSTATAVNKIPDDFKCLDDLRHYNIYQVLIDQCEQQKEFGDSILYQAKWNLELEQKLKEYDKEYVTSCLNNILSRESLISYYYLNESAYTLYYYDQARNLINTSAPEGVHPLSQWVTAENTILTDVKAHRANPGGATPFQTLSHAFTTNYKYNSFNNVIEQTTPDGGTTTFWYDRIGRVVLSQNAKQYDFDNPYTYNLDGKGYSYTLYDELGRITEVGELITTVDINQDIKDLIIKSTDFTDFVDWVNNQYPSRTTDILARNQITRTIYDENTAASSHFANGQQNVRGRVASILRIENYSAAQPNDFDYGTHYSYDIHGNVEDLVHENNYLQLTAPGQVLKSIHYDYDLVSGNVNRVTYQPGQSDQYIHEYYYDADNRIKQVYTSRNGVIWDEDAKYFYYEHGPLARMEVGEEHVAGTDYAYTLQGWLKGTNSSTLKASRDIGLDGNSSSTGNFLFARDASAFTLNYHDNDYNSINSTNFLASISGVTGLTNLYNGNISSMSTALIDDNESQQSNYLYAYKYDQLNRIKEMNTATTSASSNTFTGSLGTSYATSYTYDFNGNITELTRNDVSGYTFDNLRYKYNNNALAFYRAGTGLNYNNNTTGSVNNNQLMHVLDTLPHTNDGNYSDITDQGTRVKNDLTSNNYQYDEIGQLIKDDQEEISSIEWDVYNKVTKINYDNNNKPNLKFLYGSDGNRIAKIVIEKDIAGGAEKSQNDWKYTFYVRDAQGNNMGVYNQAFTGGTGNVYTSNLTFAEIDIYGSSRLGQNQIDYTFTNTFGASISGDNVFVPASPTAYDAVLTGATKWDTKSVSPIDVEDQVGGTFEITLEAYTDTVEVNPSGAYTILEGDPIEVGGVFKVLPGTVVQFSTANQITIDADGEYFGILGDVSLNLESASDLIIQPTVSTTEFAHTLGYKVYENTNHLGNVLTTISDRKLAYDDASNGTGVDYFIADVVSYSDYYPFGWVLPGRNGNATAYRYGYQGSEMDNEVKGSVSTQYTTYFRGLDTRVVRWWSVDPITHPHQTPYSVMNGNPIIYNDPFGDKVKYKDRASRREARRRRKTDEAFAEKLQGLKDDKRITYYLDHQKGSGRDLNVAIDEELEALKGKPLQRSPVVEWESQGEARSDLNRGNNGEDLTPMTPTRPRLSISRAGNTLPAINIAPIQMPPTNNPFIPVNNTPIWFMRNIPFNRSSDNISNSAQAELTLQPLADALINNPGVTLTIFGNTFADPTQNNASSPAWVNGQIMNYGQLMQMRGQAVANMLIGMGVSPRQLNVRQGRIINNTRGLNTTFRVNP